MNMRKLLLFILLIPALKSCTTESKKETLEYCNLIILSDLSDRIEPYINGNIRNQQFPPKDQSEIKRLLIFFRDHCVKPGEKIGDKSSISFSTFSHNDLAKIDLSLINTLSDKQQFVNSTGHYSINGLAKSISDFEYIVDSTYRIFRNQGLDLISILIDKIENKNIIKQNYYVTDGIDTTFINFNNTIYIFTDGYLEYLHKYQNSQYYFGSPEIEKIRNYCKTHNVTIQEALKANASLCLPPYNGNLNRLISLNILETHERDKDVKLQIYKHPLGLRDNEILEAVWRKWANESGFRDFQWSKF